MKTQGLKKIRCMLVALLIICLCAGMIGCGGSDLPAGQGQEQGGLTWQGQYDLGLRLLAEGDYENAVLAFREAIRIDPKKVDAYVGLADVYLAVGDVQAALEVLSQGMDAVEEADRGVLEEKQKEIQEGDPDKVTDEDKPGKSTDNDPASQEKILVMEEYIAAQFDYAGEFHEGRAVVGYEQGDGSLQFYYIDTEGVIVAGPYDYAADFCEGRAAVGMRTTVSQDAWYGWYNCYYYGYIDREGNEVIPLTYLLDSEWTQGLSFYNGLAEVNWFSDEYEYGVWTTLIDENGNKVLPEDILVMDERGYGGGDEWIDYRQMRMLAPAKDPWGTYYCYNQIQRARCGGSEEFLIKAFTGTDTIWVDESLNIVDRQPGNVIQLSKSPELYVIYDRLNSYYDGPDEGRLVDGSGNVIAEGFVDCQLWHNKYLQLTYYGQVSDMDLITGAYRYETRTLDGQIIEVPCEIYQTTENGFIGRGETDENGNASQWMVLDQNFQVMFSVWGRHMSQCSNSIYVNGAWKNQWLPCYEYYVASADDMGCYYLNEQGEMILDVPSGKSQLMLWGMDCIVGGDQDTILFCDLNGSLLYTLEGVYGLQSVYGTEDNLYMAYEYGTDAARYYIIERINGELTVTETEAVYLEDVYMTVLKEDAETEQLIRKNEISGLWGMAYDLEMPLRLEYQGQSIKEAAAMSLVSNGLYKTGEDLQLSDDFWSYDVIGVSLHAVEGGWSSAVYDGMGYLSEDFISFCKDGKWGYLKTSH